MSFNQKILNSSALKSVVLQLIVALCTFSSLQAATPGLPFTEDFANSNLKNESLSTALWSNKLQKAFLGQRNAKSLGLRSGTTTTLNISSTPISSTSRRIHSADVNGDGYPDAIANDFSRLNIHFNNRTADPFLSQIISQTGFTSNIYDIATGDIDHDGDIDIVVATFGGTNRLYLNDGSSQPFQNATALIISTDSASTRGIVLVDMNGDGWLDVVAGNESSANRLYLNTGVAPFLTGIVGTNISSDADRTYDIKVADLNNDGFPDVAVSNSISATSKYYLNDQNSDLDNNPFTAVTGVQISTDSGGFVDALDVGDVNNDGWVDIVTTGGNTNKVYLNSQNPLTPFDAATVSNTISNENEFGREIKLRDLDDDGDLDAIVAYQRARD